MNPVEIEEAVSALALEPFDPADFPFQFLTAFGNKNDDSAPSIRLDERVGCRRWRASTQQYPPRGMRSG
jgi:hypothetical protein